MSAECVWCRKPAAAEGESSCPRCSYVIGEVAMGRMCAVCEQPKEKGERCCPMDADFIRCESSSHPSEDDVATNPWQCVRCERWFCEGCGEPDEEQTCDVCWLSAHMPPPMPLVADPADEEKF